MLAIGSLTSILNPDKFWKGMLGCGVVAAFVAAAVLSGGTEIAAWQAADEAAALTVASRGLLMAFGTRLVAITAAAEVLDIGHDAIDCYGGLSTIESS